MKSKEFNELKGKKENDLLKLVRGKKVELNKLTSRIYAGREKNLKIGKNLKRDIAQIMTVIRMNKETKKGTKEVKA